MAERRHIRIVGDPDRGYRARLHYRNGRLGEGSEEAFTSLAYLVGRTRLEHPTVPIRVVSGSEDYWIEPADL